MNPLYHINGIAVRNGYDNKPQMITHQWDTRDKERSGVAMAEHYDPDCPDNTKVYCPYCKESQDEWWEVIDSRKEGEAQEIECCNCEKTFYATPSFGHGWTSEPRRCSHGGHRLSFQRQYIYEGRTWRILTCENCFESGHDVSKKGGPAFALMPWRPEYNDPNYFDPKGTLKATAIYGRCKPEDGCGCGYEGKLNFESPMESYEDEAINHWYSCPKCKEEVEPCNILDLDLKTPVLDKIERELQRYRWQQEYYKK